MNDTDIQMLQTLFDEPPPTAHVFDAGRARLQQSYRRRAFRLPRFSLPTMAGLGAAALGAAAVAAVVAVSANPAISHPPAAAQPTLQTGQVLLSATRTVSSLPATTVQPQQWLRVSYVTFQDGKASTDVEWTTFNGVRTGYYQAGKLVVHTYPGAATGDGSPMGAYDALIKLPPDPQNLLKALSISSAGDAFTSSANPEVRTWDNIVQMLWNSPVAAPPKLQMEIFVALEKLPGLRVETVKDVLGKPAIGLYLPAAGHSDLLLDPSTYQVIGRYSISTGHYSQAEQVTAKAKRLKLPPAGTVTWSVVRSTTLVHGPGQN